MSEAIATRQAVQEAVGQLRRTGRKPTFSAVRDVLGGGSKETILGHLRDLRRDEFASSDVGLPTGLLDRARPLIELIYAEAQSNLEANHAGATDRYHRTMEELEIELDEAVETEKALRKEMAAVSLAAQSLRSENGDLRTQLDAQQSLMLQRIEVIADRLSRAHDLRGRRQDRRSKKSKCGPQGTVRK